MTRWVDPLSLGPITYFNTQCVSCHGEYGSQIFDHNIAKESDDAGYRAMVEYMVVDRSNSSLSERDLDAQTAYCISLANDSVFVCIKEPVMSGGLEGEVTPGSTVSVTIERLGLRTDAVVNGHGWSISPQGLSGLKQSAGDAWVEAAVVARGPKGDVRIMPLAEAAFTPMKLRK